MFFIYKLTCVVGGKAYIGLTKGDPRRRFRQHKSYAKQGSNLCPALYGAIRLHGWREFTREILEEHETRDEANLAEIRLIASHGTLVPVGYNIELGGGASRRSPETRAKISAAHKILQKGKIPHQLHTAEVRAKISAATKGMQKRGTGWSHSEATRAKMSATGKIAQAGKIPLHLHTPEMRAKVAAAVGTPEANAKRSASMKGRSVRGSGFEVTAETRQRISDGFERRRWAKLGLHTSKAVKPY